MVANIGRIVAGAAKSRNSRDPERIVEARDARNVDGRRVEHLFAARDRQAALDFVLIHSVRAQPRSVDVEDVGVERRAGQLCPSGSFTPMKNGCSESATGPPIAPSW